MKYYRTIMIIGFVEIIIGSSAIFGNLILVALSLNTKSPNVLLFVVVAGVISTLLGIGILFFRPLAYNFLLYFSFFVFLSKILVFMGILRFDGQLEVTLHQVMGIPLHEVFKNFMIGFKNVMSLLYHGFILWYFNRRQVWRIFHTHLIHG